MNESIFMAVDEYIGSLLNEPDEILARAVKAIETSGIPPISVSANQGKFLQVMAKLCKAKKILEIGTLGGYSSIWMARALPADGQLVTLELDPHHAAVAQKNIDAAGLSKRVEIRIGKAIDLLPILKEEGAGPFDMIFIDADKPPYTEYFKWPLQLSKPGTLIIADNVIRDGKVLDPDSTDPMVNGAQRFNQSLQGNAAITATILQMVGTKEYDGMAIAVVN